MAGRWSCVAVLVVLAATAAASPRDEIHAEARAAVVAANPEAAAPFDEASGAFEAGRLDDAIVAYEKAVMLAPNVDHLQRQLCAVHLANGAFDDALKHCEQAIALARGSPYNTSALIAVLLARGQPNDLSRAYGAAQINAQAHPAHPIALEMLCRAASAYSHNTGFDRACIKRWLAAAPDHRDANLYAAMAAADDGDYDTARARLAKAKAAGLDDATYVEVAAEIGAVEEANATFPKWAHTGFWILAWALGVWMLVMLVLLGLGIALSRKAMQTDEPLGGFYKTVLVIAGACFYVTIPIVVALMVAIAGGAVLLTWTIGRKLWLGFLIALIVGYFVLAIVRSFFAQPRDPGARIDLAKLPRLRGILDDVAGAVGTGVVENVYLTPHAEIAIIERGGVASALRGVRTERCLLLGVGSFDGLTLAQLRSVLAYEYGRARHRDATGGAFTLAIQRALVSLDDRLQLAGVAQGNPGYWFLRAFAAMYAAIAHGAAHREQVVADRAAIQAAGSTAFITGQQHVVTRAMDFDLRLGDTFKEVLEKKLPLANLYTYEATERCLTEADRAKALDAAMAPMRPRIAFAETLAVARDPLDDDDDPVWSLFAGREELERAMTDVMRKELRDARGLDIPSQPTNAAS